MLSPNKRSRDTTHEGNKKKATSSYGHLKAKFAASEIESGKLQVLVQELRIASEIESGRLQVLVQELRMKLQETLKTKEELGAIVHGIACSPGNEESSDLATDHSSELSAYQAMKMKVDHAEEKNTHLVMVSVQQRNELKELKKQNELLQQGSALCRRVMEQLRDNITILSNANINGGQSVCLCNLC